jgi:hypothetical protein
MKNPEGRMGKSSLIMVFGGVLVLSLINLHLNRTTVESFESAVVQYNQFNARNVANQVMEIVLTELADDTELRVLSPQQIPGYLIGNIPSAQATYTITDTTITMGGSQIDAVKVEVESIVGMEQARVVVYTRISAGFVPNPVRAVFTANGPLDRTISNMVIDGRDHDINGNLIANNGVYGVSTSLSFVNVGGADIGGTDPDGIDYPPTFPENPNIIEENYHWGGTFPDSPDEVLGLEEGTLKQIAQSGEGGSQYVTNPKTLNYPLRGVIYVEIPPGSSTKIELEGDSGGILVIHNSAVNAKITGISSKKKLPFKGLIIADYLFHIHLDVIGAIMLLSPDLETQKKCSGNKDKKILFSREALIDVTGMIGDPGEGTGWRGRLPILGWYE